MCDSTTRHDQREIYCRRLGHQLTFEYCRLTDGETPCSKIFDCWCETFDVVQFMEAHASPTTVESLSTAPQPKVLHVASFRTPDQARSLINRLEVDGVDAYVKEQAANGTTWYRVYLGPFANEEAATRVGQNLKDQKVVMYYRLVEAEGS